MFETNTSGHANHANGISSVIKKKALTSGQQQRLVEHSQADGQTGINYKFQNPILISEPYIVKSIHWVFPRLVLTSLKQKNVARIMFMSLHLVTIVLQSLYAIINVF